MITLYGIKNCDSVKKARQWLKNNNVDYHFHDFREDGLKAEQVSQWVQELGWETLINKRSTSWKTLADKCKNQLDNQSCIPLIVDCPTLIKRPLLDTGSRRHCGFKVAEYDSLLR